MVISEGHSMQMSLLVEDQSEVWKTMYTAGSQAETNARNPD